MESRRCDAAIPEITKDFTKKISHKNKPSFTEQNIFTGNNTALLTSTEYKDKDLDRKYMHVCRYYKNIHNSIKQYREYNGIL